VRLGARCGPDSMKCNEETYAQRQRDDGGCETENYISRHLRSRHCRLERCEIRPSTPEPRESRRKRTVQSFTGRKFRTIDCSFFLFCVFHFHGRRHIGLGGRRCCDGKTRRRDVLRGRLLSQLGCHHRRSVRFGGQCSGNLDRRRHKVLNQADLKPWLEFLRSRFRVLAK